ncbi:MAG TPA: ATP-binding protein [Burkholderiaceae bacterium]
MNGPSQASPAGHAGSNSRRPTLWLLAAALACAVVPLWFWLSGMQEGQGGGQVLLSCLLMVAMGALGWHVGVRLTRQQLGAALREARVHAAQLSQLQSDWQWQTDADLHLVRWQAPLAAPASSWVGLAATQTLWERFTLAEPGAAGASLRQRLEEHAAFGELAVTADLAAGPAAQFAGRWLLRAQVNLDANGRFAGYVGTAKPLPREEALKGLPEESPAERADREAFVYSVCHDLRAPLRVVEGFARILKEEHAGALDRTGHEHLERISGAAARMHAMIDALVSLAELAARPLQTQSVDLTLLAAQIVEELRRNEPGRAVEFLAQPGLSAEGDPALLRVLLENLLGNAWKYTARQPLAQIRFEIHEAEDRREFLIADNGAGFDMRHAERLFGAFQRLHSASDFPGSGLGLASARRIVHRHGGVIRAEGEVGQGARLFFTLGQPQA